MLDHKNGSNTRTFRDVTEVGARLAGLSDKIDGTVNRPRAAIIFDWENLVGRRGHTGTEA